MTGDGVVGRVIEVDPLSAKVLLINDPTSRLTAQVQKGRWWAIAVGTLTRVKLRFISQDAKLRVGDAVVTGEGRSFRAGMTDQAHRHSRTDERRCARSIGDRSSSNRQPTSGSHAGARCSWLTTGSIEIVNGYIALPWRGVACVAHLGLFVQTSLRAAAARSRRRAVVRDDRGHCSPRCASARGAGAVLGLIAGVLTDAVTDTGGAWTLAYTVLALLRGGVSVGFFADGVVLPSIFVGVAVRGAQRTVLEFIMSAEDTSARIRCDCTCGSAPSPDC